MYFAQFWRLGVWDKAAGMVGVCLEPYSLFTDGYLLDISSQGRNREKASSFLYLFIRALIPSWGLHPHDGITSQRPQSPNTVGPPYLWVLHSQIQPTTDQNIFKKIKFRKFQKSEFEFVTCCHYLHIIYTVLGVISNLEMI